MVDGLKKAVFKLIDKTFAQNGCVTSIRKWMPESMYEIDLHLPDVDMQKWTTIPRLKIKVADPGQYRDYTPASWDAEKRTCTMLIETEHEGHGSAWAKNLRVGDTVVFAPAHAAGLPSRPGNIACFGDGSALGHFMALKQLTDRIAYPLQAVVFLSENYTLPEYFVQNNPDFEFIMKPHASGLDTLRGFTEKKNWTDITSIYLAGHIPMVSGLRKVFKKYASNQCQGLCAWFLALI